MSASEPRDWGPAFRDPDRARALKERLHQICSPDRPMTFMEVCGTHTMAIFRHGIRDLLPASLRLVSGPGCPVCVTPARYLDLALALAGRPGVTVATFGDLIRVPASSGSLELARAGGADVRIVYSPLDAMEMAAGSGSSPKAAGTVVFLAVGFETTIPAVAQAVLEADRRGLENFRILVAHRRVVPALEALLAAPDLSLDGFLLPGHVSTILGSDAYRFLLERGVSGVVAGFEPVDVFRALVRLAESSVEGTPIVENLYRRAVRAGGNPLARAAMDKVFEPVDAEWRGLGSLPRSGYRLRAEYSRFDAEDLLDPSALEEVRSLPRADAGCRCGEVLTGSIQPTECGLFAGRCTPESPVGPCMVSSEGTCAAYYKYGRR